MRWGERGRQAGLIFGGFLAFHAALWAALTVRHLAPASPSFFLLHLPGFLPLFVLWQLVLGILGLYELRRLHDLPGMLGILGIALPANWLISATYFYFFSPYIGMTPKTHLLLTLLIGHVLAFVWQRTYVLLLRARPMARHVVFLGNRGDVRELTNEVHDQPGTGYVAAPWRWPGTDLVVADGRWVEAHWRAAGPVIRGALAHRVPILNLTEFYEVMTGKVTPAHAGNAEWMLHTALAPRRGAYPALKRALDLLLAAALGLLLLPAGLALALVIRLVDGRPVLFGQTRVGFMGATFRLLKFRTMVVDARARGPFVQERDKRLLTTPLGRFLRRFRLDELPQLWNVLRGDMSLVGPRPEWVREVEVLERMYPQYHLRHLVRPGITGWAQLNFRATHNARDGFIKLCYDLYYLKNVSFALDLTILLRTAKRVLVTDRLVAAPRTAARREFAGTSALATAIAGFIGNKRR